MDQEPVYIKVSGRDFLIELSKSKSRSLAWESSRLPAQVVLNYCTSVGFCVGGAAPPVTCQSFRAQQIEPGTQVGVLLNAGPKPRKMGKGIQCKTATSTSGTVNRKRVLCCSDP